MAGRSGFSTTSRSLRDSDRLKAAKTEAVIFKPGEAWRVRRNTNTDTPLPADEPAGENPPDGAAIDYALPDSVEGAVTLEILDASNKVVRRYASTDTPEPTREEMEKQLIPLYWLRIPKTLPGTAGMHRWVWDLHYATPTAPRYEYPISAVPHDTPRTPQGVLALPGTYTVRLTVGGKALTAPLTIKMDPRVTASSADAREPLQTAIEPFCIREQQRQSRPRSALGTGTDRKTCKERYNRIERAARKAGQGNFDACSTDRKSPRAVKRSLVWTTSPTKFSDCTSRWGKPMRLPLSPNKTRPPV